MAKRICNLNEYPGLSGEGPAAIIKFAKKMEIIKRKEIRDKSYTARGEAISPEELRKTDKIEGSSLCVSQDDYMLLPPPHFII
jgi:hypothetical protein